MLNLGGNRGRNYARKKYKYDREDDDRRSTGKPARRHVRSQCNRNIRKFR